MAVLPSGRHAPILVVEDDDAVRSAIADALRDEGYEVEEAADGQLALDYLRAAAARPCVILLDLWMPNVDGETFRRRQAKEDFAAIPVIVITAASDAAARARSLGAVAWMKKPIRLDPLVEIVRAYC